MEAPSWASTNQRKTRQCLLESEREGGKGFMTWQVQLGWGAASARARWGVAEAQPQGQKRPRGPKSTQGRLGHLPASFLAGRAAPGYSYGDPHSASTTSAEIDPTRE